MPKIYTIFARKEHAEPLVYIGVVEAASDDEASQQALQDHGPESQWLEMVLAPQQAMLTVFTEDTEVA